MRERDSDGTRDARTRSSRPPLSSAEIRIVSVSGSVMSEFKAMPDSAESASAALLKVRRLMLVTLGATFLALAVVFVIIGYRVFESGGSAAPLTLVSAALPADAKVLS